MANLKRIMDLYEIIKNRLPSTFPKALLSFHQDESCMLLNTDLIKADDESTVFAVAVAETNTIERYWINNCPEKIPDGIP